MSWFHPFVIRLLVILPMALVGCAQARENLEVVRLEQAGQVIDCRGDAYRNGQPVEIQVRADDVTIRHCRITGSIRTIGLARTGEGKRLRQSSRREGHTQRAQEAAPKGLRVEMSTLQAVGNPAIYLGPGTTFTTIDHNTITGYSDTPAIYLDAESAHNVIQHNRFRIKSRREVIALDGSAHNLISSNSFETSVHGGIHLYRNCGEGGTVRHQTPSYNRIENNLFKAGPELGQHPVRVNSRNGHRHYCGDDRGYPFGSSLDDRDQGVGNTVERNRIR